MAFHHTKRAWYLGFCLSLPLCVSNVVQYLLKLLFWSAWKFCLKLTSIIFFLFVLMHLLFRRLKPTLKFSQPNWIISSVVPLIRSANVWMRITIGIKKIEVKWYSLLISFLLAFFYNSWWTRQYLIFSISEIFPDTTESIKTNHN